MKNSTLPPDLQRLATRAGFKRATLNYPGQSGTRSRPVLYDPQSRKIGDGLPGNYRTVETDRNGIIGARHVTGPRAGEPVALTWRDLAANETIDIHP